jgi:hypothetical protein
MVKRRPQGEKIRKEEGKRKKERKGKGEYEK